MGTRLVKREWRGIVSDARCGVLLIGESDRSFSHITRRLERHGCRCRFVNSYEQARQVSENIGYYIHNSTGAFPEVRVFVGKLQVAVAKPVTRRYVGKLDVRKR